MKIAAWALFVAVAANALRTSSRIAKLLKVFTIISMSEWFSAPIAPLLAA
jgi:hypothetical protein